MQNVNTCHRFSSIIIDVILCLSCTTCKELCIWETRGKTAHALQDASPKPVAQHFNLPSCSIHNPTICGLRPNLVIYHRWITNFISAYNHSIRKIAKLAFRVLALRQDEMPRRRADTRNCDDSFPIFFNFNSTFIKSFGRFKPRVSFPRWCSEHGFKTS